MALLENVKERVEKATGWGRPAARELAAAVRPRKPNPFWFRDDGIIPNNPVLPFVFYRSPVRLPATFDAAAVFEELFARNGWRDSWRNGIYDYVHYHSRIHEVLGVAQGHARVRFGGRAGRVFHLKSGDVAILPAGTGHHCLSASKDLLVVGAYPPFGTYDECRASTKEHDRAIATVRKVARPRKDPVYGGDGPLMQLWQRD
ncbi:MAG: cupin domain-containing protein [Xanthobacteraceae bacterium]